MTMPKWDDVKVAVILFVALLAIVGGSFLAGRMSVNDKRVEVVMWQRRADSLLAIGRARLDSNNALVAKATRDSAHADSVARISVRARQVIMITTTMADSLRQAYRRDSVALAKRVESDSEAYHAVKNLTALVQVNETKAEQWQAEAERQMQRASDLDGARASLALALAKANSRIVSLEGLIESHPQPLKASPKAAIVASVLGILSGIALDHFILSK